MEQISGNGQPAWVAYQRDVDGTCLPHAGHVFTLDRAAVARIAVLHEPAFGALFAAEVSWCRSMKYWAGSWSMRSCGEGLPMPAEANVTQAQRWNGESGRKWIADRVRHAAIRHRLTPHLLRAADISRGDRVLDIGCGCGETTIAAAQAAGGVDDAVSRSDNGAPDGRTDGGAVGLDLSAPMLEVARGLAGDACVSNVSFIEGDAQVYPLALASYDGVISSFGVMFFDDPAAAFANIVKALRPAGKLAFLCWQGDLRNELFGIPLRAFMTHTHLPEVADDFWADQAKVTRLLADVGLSDIVMEAISEPARLGSDVADVMGYVTGMRMVTGLVAELADDALTERVLATMQQEYADRQGPGGVWVQTAAWLVSARRQ